MSHTPEVTIAETPAQVWRVLAAIDAWPSWSPSITSVVSEQSTYRVEQPPLPLAHWTITDWQPEHSFTWETRGVSSLLSAEFKLTARGRTTIVTYDLQWSGPMAWMARATYGPMTLRYAEEHLAALARRCDAGPMP